MFNQYYCRHEDLVIFRVDFHHNGKYFFGDEVQILCLLITVPELYQLVDADSGSSLGSFVDSISQNSCDKIKMYTLKGRIGLIIFVVFHISLPQGKTHSGPTILVRMLAGQCCCCRWSNLVIFQPLWNRFSAGLVACQWDLSSLIYKPSQWLIWLKFRVLSLLSYD